MTRPKFDVGIVVPLKEEFRYILEVAPLLDSISHDGTYFYRLDFGKPSTVCVLADQMGPLPALQAASRLLEFADVKLLVVLGLAGALDEGLSIGDVVVASETNEFQANSKAEPAGDGYEVRYSGRHWHLDFRIREAVTHFEFSSDGAFADWLAATSHDYEKLEVVGKERICSPPPSLHLGPIASGSVVAASSAFAAEVKRVNRKFIAIDMEAAGAAAAAEERIHPVPCLIVRGISDAANEDKKTIEKQGKGVWRRYCVRNAALLLRGLLSWEGFVRAAELQSSGTQSQIEATACQLARRLEQEIGGPWMVGVALGVYQHGPRLVNNNNAVPMDLSRLRVLDRRIDRFLEAVDQQKENLSQPSNLQALTEESRHLIEDFRKELNSPAADQLLRDFDHVVMDILCPEDAETQEVESLLLEATRLEEQAGPEAVLELLATRVDESPRIRSRYVEALASSGKWKDIREVIEKARREELSRAELEHGLFACAKLGEFDSARTLMSQHQAEYDDNAAKLFRRQTSRQFPQMRNKVGSIAKHD